MPCLWLVAISVVAAMFGYNRVDAVFGLVVSALILHTGISLGAFCSAN